MKTKERTIWIMAPVLAISIGFLVPKAAAQSDPYPKRAHSENRAINSAKWAIHRIGVVLYSPAIACVGLDSMLA
jgi:hypothetical protein